VVRRFLVGTLVLLLFLVLLWISLLYFFGE
jgi:hypothetical protein